MHRPDLFQRGAAFALEHRDDLAGFAPLPGCASVRGGDARLFRAGGLVLRGSLLRRHVGRWWRNGRSNVGFRAFRNDGFPQQRFGLGIDRPTRTAPFSRPVSLQASSRVTKGRASAARNCSTMSKERCGRTRASYGERLHLLHLAGAGATSEPDAPCAKCIGAFTVCKSQHLNRRRLALDGAGELIDCRAWTTTTLLRLLSF
jgi:hypothetical protein